MVCRRQCIDSLNNPEDRILLMKVISPKSLLFLFLWLPWLANLEAAQIRVVKKADGGKHRLTLDELRVSGEMGKAFQATLRHNLERSGWFEMTSDRNAGIGV